MLVTRSLRVVVVVSSLVVFAVLAGSLSAQLVGPFGPFPPFGPPPPPGGTVGGLPGGTGGGVIPDIKTPPLSAGDSIIVPIDVHNPGPALPNWAGVLVQVQLIDPTEVDVASITVLSPGGPVTIPDPFGPASQNVPGTVTYTVFEPNAFNSGVNLLTSSNFGVIDLELVAKNTNPINNSDRDIGLRFADIYHVPDRIVQTTVPGAIHIGGGGGSTTILKRFQGSQNGFWPSSHRVWVSSQIDTLGKLHMTADGHNQVSRNPFPNGTPPPGGNGFQSFFNYPGSNSKGDPVTGHWLHFPDVNWHRVTSTVPVHLTGNPGLTSVTIPTGALVNVLIPGSTIFALPFAATASIGIEHIPEPMAPVLLACGVASALIGFRAKRRRRMG